MHAVQSGQIDPAKQVSEDIIPDNSDKHECEEDRSSEDFSLKLKEVAQNAAPIEIKSTAQEGADQTNVSSHVALSGINFHPTEQSQA